MIKFTAMLATLTALLAVGSTGGAPAAAGQQVGPGGNDAGRGFHGAAFVVDWNLELHRFSNRVTTYVALMDDRYPSTDEHQSVHLDYEYPNVMQDLNRWLPLAKWFLAIPHYLALLVLDLGVVLAVVWAWFAILLTGRYPQGAFDFVVGVMRWHNRVIGYAFALTTDVYPPFRLAA